MGDDLYYAARGYCAQFDSMAVFGRLLPVTIRTPSALDRPLLGESRHSSKEFICSVRPYLNDRYRLEAAGQFTENSNC